MGGIHATMCQQEALQHADSIVTGEAENVWAEVLRDAKAGRLRPIYTGGYADMASVPPARHDLLSGGYAFGVIQTTRGCPLNCEFCSVSAFNGNRYRLRPIDNVIQEFRSIPEKRVFVVDDNLIGTTASHLERAKELFRAMIQAKVSKEWFAQVTVNMADDEELLRLAAQAGCQGVFIGFESSTAQGVAEVGKRFNLRNDRDLRASVRRIQRHKMLVVGSFILGLDTDEPGVGRRIAGAARHYGVDLLNTLFLTPLPGTRLWERMRSQNRIVADDFPHDWQYYTLGFPTALYKRFSWAEILAEMIACDRQFYAMWPLICRVTGSFVRRRHPFWSLVSNMSFRNNIRLARRRFSQLDPLKGNPIQAPA